MTAAASQPTPRIAIVVSPRERGIALRGGCFCNPGAAEHAFAIPAARAAECLQGRFTVPRLRACLDGPAVGALRVSLGMATTAGDLDALLSFIGDETS